MLKRFQELYLLAIKTSFLKYESFFLKLSFVFVIATILVWFFLGSASSSGLSTLEMRKVKLVDEINRLEQKYSEAMISKKNVKFFLQMERDWDSLYPLVYGEFDSRNVKIDWAQSKIEISVPDSSVESLADYYFYLQMCREVFGLCYIEQFLPLKIKIYFKKGVKL